MPRPWHSLFYGVLAVLALTSCSRPSAPPRSSAAKLRYQLSGPLVPARMTMVTAWDVPNNPMDAGRLDDSAASKEIQWGYRLFTNTPGEAPHLAPGQVSCSNCHLNAGQRERALPVVGIAGAFPEYNRRAGRPISLADRVVECFLRSENAVGTDTRVTTTTKEVLAISAYLAWLSRDHVGPPPPWRGKNTIAATALIPVTKLDPAKGEALFKEHCTNCHGPDGQGVFVGDKRPAPLWGPKSWNDGAGAARVYTLAGMIRYTMPYLNPGSLTDEESQQLAAFITSKPRPEFPLKAGDYPVDPLPPDAVYYPPRRR